MDVLILSPGRELAQRVSGGIEVTLYWNAEDDSTTVEVWHAATGELLILSVAPERALEAYYHPFAHLTPAPESAEHHAAFS